MRRDRKRGVLALPVGVNWADIEFDVPLPEPRPNKKKRGSQKEITERKRYFFEKRFPFIKARKLVQQLARQVAYDLLELRADKLVENEKAWRDQQQREARAYAERLSAAFRTAVKKEAAGKS